MLVVFFSCYYFLFVSFDGRLVCSTACFLFNFSLSWGMVYNLDREEVGGGGGGALVREARQCLLSCWGCASRDRCEDDK